MAISCAACCCVDRISTSSECRKFALQGRRIRKYWPGLLRTTGFVSHDRATLPDYAYSRVLKGSSMPGVLIISDRFPVGEMIDHVLLLVECSVQAEWNGRIVFLPI